MHIILVGYVSPYFSLNVDVITHCTASAYAQMTHQYRIVRGIPPLRYDYGTLPIVNSFSDCVHLHIDIVFSDSKGNA